MTRIKLRFARAAATGALALAPALAAAGWTNIPVDTSLLPFISSARVCKTAVNSIYGLLWRPNFQVFRNSTLLTGIGIRVFRLPSVGIISREWQNQWLYGVVAGTGGNVFASPFHDDRFVFDLGIQGGGWSPTSGAFTYTAVLGSMRPGEIANC